MTIAIWDDLHNERSGYRAFVVDSPDSDIGVTLYGYCEPGNHSFKTVRQAAEDARRRCPGATVYRNGRIVN